MNSDEQNNSPEEPIAQVWKSTKYANLRIYASTGVYHVNAKIKGKLIRQSLHTTSATIAQLKRDELLSELRVSTPSAEHRSLKTFKEAAEEYLARVRSDTNIKPSTVSYREETVTGIRSKIVGVDEIILQRVTKEEARRWIDLLSSYGATRFNGTCGTLRGIFENIGLKFPVAIDPKKIRPRKPKIPSQEKLREIFSLMQAREKEWPRWQGCSLMARLLACSGMRISEANYAQVEHADFEKGILTVAGHPDPKIATKNGMIRLVPMNDELRKVLKECVSGRASGKLLPIENCRYSLKEACIAAGSIHLTPHDLRDVFATRCIESGVDIPTVSKWLGHRDGGALLMRVYAHLRDEHSMEMAKKIKF